MKNWKLFRCPGFDILDTSIVHVLLNQAICSTIRLYLDDSFFHVIYIKGQMYMFGYLMYIILQDILVYTLFINL